MDRRTSAGTFFGVALSGGIAALIGLTALESNSAYVDALYYGGIAAMVAGCAGFAWLLISARRNDGTPIARPPSTTIKVQGGGDLDIEDLTSTAHTLIDAKRAKSVRVRKTSHNPGSNGDRDR